MFKHIVNEISFLELSTKVSIKNVPYKLQASLNTEVIKMAKYYYCRIHCEVIQYHLFLYRFSNLNSYNSFAYISLLQYFQSIYCIINHSSLISSINSFYKVIFDMIKFFLYINQQNYLNSLKWYACYQNWLQF